MKLIMYEPRFTVLSQGVIKHQGLLTDSFITEIHGFNKEFDLNKISQFLKMPFDQRRLVLEGLEYRIPEFEDIQFLALDVDREFARFYKNKKSLMEQEEVNIGTWKNYVRQDGIIAIRLSAPEYSSSQ